MAYKKGDKRKVRGFRVSPTQNKGFLINVEHHPPARSEGKGAKAAFGSSYVPDEQFGHSSGTDAQAHIQDLMNRMTPNGPGTPS